MNRMKKIRIEEWAVPALQIMLFPIWIVGGLLQMAYYKYKNNKNPKGSYYNVDGTLVIPSKLK